MTWIIGERQMRTVTKVVLAIVCYILIAVIIAFALAVSLPEAWLRYVEYVLPPVSALLLLDMVLLTALKKVREKLNKLVLFVLWIGVVVLVLSILLLMVRLHLFGPADLGALKLALMIELYIVFVLIPLITTLHLTTKPDQKE